MFESEKIDVVNVSVEVAELSYMYIQRKQALVIWSYSQTTQR